MLTAERRARNRAKLMSLRRYSGFLKRPEILETVYSVEDPEDDMETEKEQDRLRNISETTTDNDASTDDEFSRFLSILIV